MTEVRQSLARAITALADEVDGLEESIRPARRLGQLGLDLAALDREIAELTETHQPRPVTSHRLAIRNTRSGVVEQLGELARVLPGRNGGRFLRERYRRRRVGPWEKRARFASAIPKVIDA
jgi:hypothetical protein